MTDDVKTSQSHAFIQLDDDANAFDLAAAISNDTVEVILTNVTTGAEVAVTIDPDAGTATARVVYE